MSGLHIRNVLILVLVEHTLGGCEDGGEIEVRGS